MNCSLSDGVLPKAQPVVEVAVHYATSRGELHLRIEPVIPHPVLSATVSHVFADLKLSNFEVIVICPLAEPILTARFKLGPWGSSSVST